MIRAESRMREIRTSGSTSGGVETDRMGAGLSTKAKARTQCTGPYRKPRHPLTLLPDSRTAHGVRAEPSYALDY